MELFDRNKKTIKQIKDDFESGKLIIDSSYQRRSVWSAQDNIRLIETILMGYIVPEVFLWPASVDPDTGDTVTHIVDGQQRITAIIDFIEGKYKLTKKYLLDDTIAEKCGDKYFTDLLDEDKSQIWTYKLSTVDIDKSWNIDQIKKMFYRLNLTDYSLNGQEKRNSIDSAFGTKSELLAQNDFWRKVHVFSANDYRRMKDSEYCCSIYILAKEGPVDQVNDRKINQYYDDYKESFDDDGTLEKRISSAMDIIIQFVDESTISFISKKAQLYTMFCVCLKMDEDKVGFSDSIFSKFKLFVAAYNLFRNEYDIVFGTEITNAVYESIKKYKLASSEGINKLQNRMIRYEQLYKICISSGDNVLDSLVEIVKALTSKREENLTIKEELIDIDEY